LYNYKLSKAYATQQDEDDALKNYRAQFYLPKDPQGNPLIYMTGNSLGLQPKTTNGYVNQELKDWAQLGVEGHFEAKNPWLSYHELLTENMAHVVGAKPQEVVVMNTLTTNLHLMMVSFYKPTAKRYKILIESDAFPSDKYAVESQLRHHGYNHKDGIVYWSPRAGENVLRHEDLESILKTQGEEIALIMLGGVNYYTGQFLDLKLITNLGHAQGCHVGFDCAHGAGNVALNLHDSGADFAVWCTYKYLNSGPGSLGPPILSMAAIKASLDIFKDVGMDNLIKKSKKLTQYFEFLITQINNNNISIITPSNPQHRGCQLSIQVKNANKTLHKKLTNAGVISDWRDPNVIRCAPVPLYNSYLDVFNMVEKLKTILKTM